MKNVTYWRRWPSGRWSRYTVQLPDEGARQFCRDIRHRKDFRGVKVRPV